MPLAAQNRDRDYFFAAATFDQKKYSLVGYAGALDLTDIAVLIMHVAGGHMVALPGASDRCVFIGTTAAWFGQAFFIVLGGWVQVYMCMRVSLFPAIGCSHKVKRAIKNGLAMGYTCFRCGGLKTRETM